MHVHVEEVAHVESLTGNDEKEGTWISLRGIAERRYCLEPAKKVREMIEEEKSKEEVHLDTLAIGLLLKAANRLADGKLHFTESSDGLTVTAGGVVTEPLQGRDRSRYEHAEKQISGYALVEVESKGVYRLNERGYHMAEFLIVSQHPGDQPFRGFAKLPASFSGTPAQGVQLNQWISNSKSVNTAVSEKGNVEQSVK